MKNLIKVLTAAVIVSVFLFTGCEKKEIKDNKSKFKNQAFSEKEVLLLKQRYGFDSLYSYIDKTKDIDFIVNVKSNKFVEAKSNKNIEELDFEKVTEIINGEDILYSIPYIGNETKYLILPSINDNLNSVILENQVGTDGNGIIYITTNNDFVKITFVNGKIIEYITNNKKMAFRECFDSAYDDICNDAIGCLAWYTNPQIAVMVIAYCSMA